MRVHSARPSRRRRGIALPLALLVVLAVAMFAALLLDASLQAVRSGRAAASASRAQVALETALAVALAAQVDSGGRSMAAGVAWDSSWAAAGDSMHLTVQSLGGSVRRVVATAAAGAGDARGAAGALVYVRVVADSAGPAVRWRLQPVSGWWWSPNP